MLYLKWISGQRGSTYLVRFLLSLFKIMNIRHYTVNQTKWKYFWPEIHNTYKLQHTVYMYVV